MNYPKVSVIIPTYNRADLLSRAIESVLSQTFKCFELIIVDDASTDNTKEVVEEIQKRDQRIRYIRLDKNSGAPAHPRNVGIQNAKGEYIAFLDHDDEWLPEKLKKQIELFENSKKKNLGFVGCNALIIDEQDGKKYEYRLPRVENVFRRLLESNFVWSASSVIVKKSVINDIGLFDERLKNADDWDMWIRIAQKYNFDFVPEVLFKYYLHKNNTTKLTPLNFKEKDLKIIFEKYRSYYYRDAKVYSTKLRYDGSRYILAGDLEKGRECFIKSIKLNPLNFKSYLYLLISLFGLGFYHDLSRLKMRLRKYRIFDKI